MNHLIGVIKSMGDEEKKRKPKNKIKVEDNEGLTLSYNREELDERFPHLTKEMFEKKKSIKMDSVDYEIEKDYKEKSQKSNKLYPNELYNPGVIDFIRRCTKKEDAINLLNYLLRRNEISNNDYNTYRNIILKEGGLERLIAESGGLKRPGYYMRKYYKKATKNQKLNSNDN
ncbi:MAG: DUF2095 domain-containing protein [Promethearchaeota archaeon]|nr:MAG: DUF2095 domain-containing protein [Candidatus Lokiarchaeota archaeon]